MTTTADRLLADTASVDAIIDALYDVISGPAGARDYGRMRNLFLPGARLIPTDPLTEDHAGGEVLDPEAFIDKISPVLQVQPFYEVEVARRTEQFGPVVHLMSTYESRASADGEPFERGVNSIQLMRRDGRWWVVTVFWSIETGQQPVPQRYLPDGN
jgi:hypothetical protein